MSFNNITFPHNFQRVIGAFPQLLIDHVTLNVLDFVGAVQVETACQKSAYGIRGGDSDLVI